MTFSANSFSFEGSKVHYIEGGVGFPILMIHGSGPGVSTMGNWRSVLDPLAQRFHVFAMDLIGFGLSGRKPTPPYFDFQLWLRQCKEMISRMPGREVGIIGHSVSAALALRLAGDTPRVRKVLTTGAMGANFRANEHTRRTWTFPENREELRRVAETLIFDHRRIDEEFLKNRESILFQGDYKNYFSSMFDGDKQQYIDAAVISSDDLAKIDCDVSMLHGRNDLAFPMEVSTLALARSLPKADITILGRCSHSVAMERPEKLLAAAVDLFPAHGISKP